MAVRFETYPENRGRDNPGGASLEAVNSGGAAPGGGLSPCAPHAIVKESVIQFFVPEMTVFAGASRNAKYKAVPQTRQENLA